MDQANETTNFDDIYIRRIMSITEAIAFYIKNGQKVEQKLYEKFQLGVLTPKHHIGCRYFI